MFVISEFGIARLCYRLVELRPRLEQDSLVVPALKVDLGSRGGHATLFYFIWQLDAFEILRARMI